MKFCSNCGGRVTLCIPEGDDRERYLCNGCSTVHYQNPKIVAGCLITHKERILLCRRAIEPEYGLWTLPAGFMENGETTEQAAVRESWEEGRARVISKGLYAVINFPQISQVYLFYRGELTGFNVGSPGHESSNVGLFAETEIPWGQLAFNSLVNPILKGYFSDRNSNQYNVRCLDVDNLELWSSEDNVPRRGAGHG